MRAQRIGEELLGAEVDVALDLLVFAVERRWADSSPGLVQAVAGADPVEGLADVEVDARALDLLGPPGHRRA